MRHGSRWSVFGWVVALVVVVSSSTAYASHEDPARPNDPLFTQEGTLDFIQWGPRQIRAEEAWHTATGAGATIAVVDTGVDLDHEDLSAKLLSGATFLECAGDKNASCGNGDWESGPAKRSKSKSPHGTHVAGTAAAATDNGTGVAGVAPAAQILPVKVLDEEGGTFEDIARGIRWSADHGADVINLSLGVTIAGLLPGSQIFTILGDESAADKAIAYARSKGVVVVAAAGNESFPLCTDPAFGSGALCVTATDIHEGKPAYANSSLNESLTAVAAPGGGEADYIFFCGGGILSTVPTGTADPGIAESCGYPSNLGYDEMIGTSMATPHAAGVAALLVSAGCRGDDVVSRMTSTARQPITGLRGTFTPAYGYGIVDAGAAVTAQAPACSGGGGTPTGKKKPPKSRGRG